MANLNAMTIEELSREVYDAHEFMSYHHMDMDTSQGAGSCSSCEAAASHVSEAQAFIKTLVAADAAGYGLDLPAWTPPGWKREPNQYNLAGEPGNAITRTDPNDILF